MPQKFTLVQQSWRLHNIAELAASNKYIVHLPDPVALVSLAAGQYVSVIASLRGDAIDDESPSAEQLWLRIAEVVRSGVFKGQILPEPEVVRDLAQDSVIEFESHHIAEIYGSAPSREQRLHLSRCVVTCHIAEDGEKVGLMWRDEPCGEGDSGWRFCSGKESRDYLADAENLMVVRLGDLLQMDDTFVGLLGSPVGARFRRQGDNKFTAVPPAEVIPLSPR